MNTDEQPTARSLGELIASADEGRATPEPPLPSGWAGVVERDRRARLRSHPNATGGFFNILYPWRLYIVVGAAFVVVLLVVVDLIS